MDFTCMLLMVQSYTAAAHLKEEVDILGFIIGGHHLQQCLQVLHGQAPAIEGHKGCLQVATTMIMKAVTKQQ